MGGQGREQKVSVSLDASASTFANWNLFPFDEYPLPLPRSRHFVDGLLRQQHQQQSQEQDQEQDQDNDAQWRRTVQHINDIKPEDALTPSLKPIEANDIDIGQES